MARDDRVSPQQSIFKCMNCGAPLGVVAGASLRLQVLDARTGDFITVEFDEKPVSPRCGKCKQKRQWTPDKKTRARMV